MELDKLRTLGSLHGPEERCPAILKIPARDDHLSILNLLFHVLQPDKPQFKAHRDRFIFNPSGRGKLIQVLDYILDDQQGYMDPSSWLEERAMQFVLDKVAKEMDEMKSALTWSTKNTIPETLLTGTLMDLSVCLLIPRLQRLDLL